MANKADVYEIKVYDKENNVIKTCQAIETNLKFGAVRKIMALLSIEDIDNTAELIKAIYGAWEQLTAVLNQFFPDMNDNDWDNVYIEELVPVVMGIMKSTFNKILSIPNESKN